MAITVITKPYKFLGFFQQGFKPCIYYVPNLNRFECARFETLLRNLKRIPFEILEHRFLTVFFNSLAKFQLGLNSVLKFNGYLGVVQKSRRAYHIKIKQANCNFLYDYLLIYLINFNINVPKKENY
jgi:hypothetical protein